VNVRRAVSLLVVLAGAGLAAFTPFVVEVGQFAVVTRFGRPVATYAEPGLHFRIPIVDQVVRIDGRLLLTEPPVSEYLTLDKKNVIARPFLAWRVKDPLRFLQTVLLRESAEARLSAVTSSELGAALGSVPFEALVSVDPQKMRLSKIAEGVEQRVHDTAAREYGIDVVSLRLERLAFPQQNEAAVFQRMRAERERIARQFRSEGEEASLKIRAEADRERSELLAEADRKAAQIRGEAEAEAARVYAEALKQDPEFFRFVRTLESYDKIIDDKTTIVLPADSPLMRTLVEGPPGAREKK